MERLAFEKKIEALINEAPEKIDVVSICTNCNSIVYCGGDRTAIEVRILRERLLDHLVFFDGKNHNVLVIFPKRKTDYVITAEGYLTTGAGITAETGMKHHVRKV
jgi:hypothetical protein